MNIRLYARFSPRPDKAIVDGDDSVDRQLDQLRAWAADNEHVVMGEYFDKAISGNKGYDDPSERPGLWDCMRELRRGEAVVVRCWDRLARSTMLAEYLHHEAGKIGARIVSVEVGDGPETPESTLIRQVMQVTAEYQRHIICARTKAAMRRYQEQGRRMGSLVPYGWQEDPNDRSRMIPSESEQATIKRVFELRQAGLSYPAMDAALRDEDHMPRNATKWHTQQLRRLLSRG